MNKLLSEFFYGLGHDGIHYVRMAEYIYKNGQ